ncbi:MAG: hypothetical protein ACPGVO_18270 [Spirulinaceae cyanobacterium]
MSGSRPTGVTILAILSVIGGLLSILGGAAAILLGGLAGLGGAAQGSAEAAGVGAAAFVIGIFVIALGLANLVVAYGLWNLKGWAWIVCVVLQGISVLSALVQLVNGAGGAVFSIVIAGVILYYLFRPNVKAAFGR